MNTNNQINSIFISIFRFVAVSGITAVILLTASCDINEHHHGAHVHGEAQLSLILDDTNTLVAEFRSPAHDIIGFEHKPGSDEERHLSESVLQDLEKNYNAYIQTESGLKCRLDSAKAEPGFSADDHMDITAFYRIKCEHSLEGSEIKVFFTEKFPDLEKLHITLVTATRQESIILSKNKNIVKL